MEGIEGYQEGHDGCRAQSHIPGGAQEDIHKASREGRVEAVLGRQSSHFCIGQRLGNDCEAN